MRLGPRTEGLVLKVPPYIEAKYTQIEDKYILRLGLITINV